MSLLRKWSHLGCKVNIGNGEKEVARMFLCTLIYRAAVTNIMKSAEC